jgi:hypothetical protein
METFKVNAKTSHYSVEGEEYFFFYFNESTTLEKTKELVTHVPRFDKNYFSKYEIIELLEGIRLNTKNKLNGKEITYLFLTDEKNT